MDMDKLKNFWYYNKTYILIGLVVAAFLLWNFLPSNNKTENYDFCLAIVCPEYFDDEQIDALENSLSAKYGRAKVYCYHMKPGTDELQDDVEVSCLDYDLISNTSQAFMVEDPDAFREVVSVELSSPVPVKDVDYLRGLGFDAFYIIYRS